MEILNANSKQRKKAIKKVIKTALKDKNTKGLIKACYIITWILRSIACLLGLLTIYYAIFISDYIYIDLLYLIITFLFPFLFSYVSATVYMISLSKEYRYRSKESITLMDNGFVYAYHDDRIDLSDAIFSFNVKYNQLNKYEYCKETKVLDLYGEIAVDTYENGKLKESNECRQLSMLDVYERSIHQLLEEKIQPMVSK